MTTNAQRPEPTPPSPYLMDAIAVCYVTIIGVVFGVWGGRMVGGR